ncbi:MAG TPA: MarR family transcriptional regulator [Candidatus Dormibacteraeota bacterium]|nr:MarR family transcriptional regulator [Candidatus Dormibacteraeota bacterium]
MEAESELRQLTTAIDGLDEKAALRFGINRTDLRCVDVLTSVGPQKPTELAAAVGLTSGGLSIALERLEKAGYIRRRQHEHDRRSVVVEATVKAHSVDEEIFGRIEQRMRRLFGSYDSDELEVILRFLRETRATISS